jgi:sugar lactone lactonase YvrE
VKRLLVVALVILAVLPARAENIGHTTVFARVPAPGLPEGLAVRGGLVYTGTHEPARGNAGNGPSKIFAYDLSTRRLVRTITVTGEHLEETHGVTGLAFDGAGYLYALDRYPARVLRFDMSVNPAKQSTYSMIPDLPACSTGASQACSPTTLDLPPFPDGIAFGPDGSTYVSDLQGATIFRVPLGGGAAKIWFQDARLDGVFGVNGFAVGPDRRTLYFTMTGSQQPTSLAAGIIYTLPLVNHPTASDLKTFARLPQPVDGPDGLAFGSSGKLYIALAGANQMTILNRDGSVAARFPDLPTNYMAQEIPYDTPASVAFDGKGNLLVANQSYITGDSTHWAILRAYVNDRALPLIEPRIDARRR